MAKGVRLDHQQGALVPSLRSAVKNDLGEYFNVPTALKI